MRWRTLTDLVLSAVGLFLTAQTAFAQEGTQIPLLEAIPAIVDRAPSLRGDTLVLTIDQALARAFASNPSLREARALVKGGEGSLQQATTSPNPELAVDVEDFARRSTGGASQTTIALSQSIPLWGKRSAKREQADSERDVARAGVAMVMLGLYRETTVAFAALLGAQASAGNAQGRLRLAQEFESVVKMRVDEGAVSISEYLRSQASTALARVDSLRAESDRERAQTRLASLWGDEIDRPIAAVGDLDLVEDPAPFDTLLSLLSHHPELVALRANVRAREAEWRLAISLGRPDPSFTIGYRRLHDASDNAIIAGLSLPLPLFDRNKGNALTQAARVEEAQAALEAATLGLSAELRELWQQVSGETQEIRELRDRVLPATQQSLEHLDQAYRLGRQPYINVLDAQRAEAEIQSRLVEVLVSRAQTKAAVESLIGQDLDNLRRQ